MNKPLREHFETPTDAGDALQTFRYIDALENYIQYLEKQAGCIKHGVSGKQFLEWININEKLPPEHDLVLTLTATGHLSLSRYVSNDFPSGAVLWAEIELPKIACASGAVDKTVCDGSNKDEFQNWSDPRRSTNGEHGG